MIHAVGVPTSSGVIKAEILVGEGELSRVAQGVGNASLGGSTQIPLSAQTESACIEVGKGLPVFADGVGAKDTNQWLNPGIAVAFPRRSLQLAREFSADASPVNGHRGIAFHRPVGVDVGIDDACSHEAYEAAASLLHPWFLNRSPPITESQIDDGLIGFNIEIKITLHANGALTQTCRKTESIA